MMRGKRDDLSRPTTGRSLGVHYDPEAFGAATEGIARFLGTGRYLAMQTIVVIIWLTLNIGGWFVWNWDTYPFILLNLAFSTQAAYAAPLILLAQNRQDDRDRAQQERDRDVQARTQADTEYLARELTSVRLTLADVVTADDLRDAVDRVTDALNHVNERLDRLEPEGSVLPRADADRDR